jgi:hypothetical protein
LVDPEHIPAQLRLATRTARGRAPICDIVGPPRSEYRIDLLDDQDSVVATDSGIVGEAEFAVPKRAAPAPGNYRLQFRLNDRLIGTERLLVEPTLPSTWNELKSQWIVSRMPVIEERLPVRGR